MLSRLNSLCRGLEKVLTKGIPGKLARTPGRRAGQALRQPTKFVLPSKRLMSLLRAMSSRGLPGTPTPSRSFQAGRVTSLPVPTSWVVGPRSRKRLLQSFRTFPLLYRPSLLQLPATLAVAGIRAWGSQLTPWTKEVPPWPRKRPRWAVVLS